MTTEKIGDINVDMGSGNVVGDIGHKITFHQPPPDPNAIWQDGNPVGKIGSPPVAGDGTYSFAKLFFDGPFDLKREISIQGVRLQVERMDHLTASSSGGRPKETTLWNAICRIIA